MNYHFSIVLNTTLEEAIAQVTDALKQEGFGILTEINVQNAFAKHGIDFHDYRILGACHPQLAHRALQADDKAGTLFPCNVVVQERGEGAVEVSAVNPLGMLKAVEHPDVQAMAEEASQKMEAVIRSLKTPVLTA
ncbi:DUF302 domain-containing protein [Roseofilum reptotaenium CS-1145]|uniref:DUF302 domain-containing protein n=1 Tax=Roseofilum reptotaenium AO1-A TaxID=1925591 RepID=A0A1L9QSS3_9CYAN|nr:DUF302 domain-containing protein [Roseofilum reptotaenium]MDB9519477.1 DUF302 domain-containing protein [Roseofilum reptotaenium CS-1145]OJJ25740.1 hypothetical protein BI308_09455 [Roseofilum reptotaenium AO1-A]